MNSVAIKGIVGTLSLGAVSASGYGLYRLSLKEETVKQKLSSEKKVLNTDLNSTEDNESWKTLIKKHKEQPTTSPRLSEYTDSTNSEPEEADIKKIKEACSKVLEVKLSEEGSDKKMEIAKLWCSVDK